jgi:hypothetical protein
MGSSPKFTFFLSKNKSNNNKRLTTRQKYTGKGFKYVNETRWSFG